MNAILQAYGLSFTDYKVERIGSGYIHQTFRLVDARGLGYILQRVNKNVFRNPEVISENLKIAGDYLLANFPEYNFLRTIPALSGAHLFYDADGFPWRMFTYQEGTVTIERVETAQQAYKAAAGFGDLTARLNKVEQHAFRETIPEFHNLSSRYGQFLNALNQASRSRREEADRFISICQNSYTIVEMYEDLIASGRLTPRITHNDTKINNILFDGKTGEVVTVIDLDTLMPGYFIYDLGDMIRTFVNPVTEDEDDYRKIVFRKNIYDAVVEGYMSKMGYVLTDTEREAIPFAGKMMTFIMALRFLTDFLNNDTYYHTFYHGQNMIRAGNQLAFLELLKKFENQ